MDEVIPPDTNLTVEAVRVWTGWGTSNHPLRDDCLLIQRFGDGVASKLIPMVKSLEDEFYLSNARIVAKDLQEMGILAALDFRKKNPNMPEEIAQAFSWCYTYDYK